MPATGSPLRAHRRSPSNPPGRCPRAAAHRVWPVVSPVRAAPTRCRSDHWGSASRGGRQHGDVQLSTFGTPHPRFGCQRRNHNRFLRLNNFVDRLLEAGVHGYVPKSLGIAEVTAALKAVFEGAVYVPSFLSEIPPNTEEANLTSTETSAATPEAVLRALTPRQQDVLNLIVKGESNKQIARALNLGEGTIKVHVAALFRNLGVNSRAAAAAAGARLIAAAGERSQKPALP